MNRERVVEVIANLDEPTKHLFDGISLGTIVATFLGWLPHVATLLSIVWVAIRIWETDTVQRLARRKK